MDYRSFIIIQVFYNIPNILLQLISRDASLQTLGAMMVCSLISKGFTCGRKGPTLDGKKMACLAGKHLHASNCQVRIVLDLTHHLFSARPKETGCSS